MVVYKSTVKFARDNSQWPTLCPRGAIVKITLLIDDASPVTLVAVLLNFYFYSAHDLNFRDRLFAIYFVRFIRFINLSFYIFSDIILLYPQKYIKSAFGYSKYDPRSFNSVRLLREIEMRIDFLSRFWEFTASLLANYIATCVECNLWEWIPPQSTLMSVSSGKVNTLKSRFNLSSALLLLALSRFLFSESEMILFPASDVPSKFVQIYLLTFLQNIARLTRRIPSRWLFIVLFLTWIERKHLLQPRGNYIVFYIWGVIKLAENGYDYFSQNT